MHVSIVIPTYNRSGFLAKTLASVQAQKHRPIDLVIVDDGSNDSTAAMVSQFIGECASVDFSICYLFQDNSGAPVARNLGWRSSLGEAVLFLDSDDELAPAGISALVEALSRDASLDFAIGKVLRTDRMLNSAAGERIGSLYENKPAALMDYNWHTMGALYRRSFLAETKGWRPDIRGADDWVFQAKVKALNPKMALVDVLVGFWRDHDEERVGAKRFRASYTLDVVRAAQAILENAESVGFCDVVLRRRLWMRMIKHCWELGFHKALPERDLAFQILLETTARHKPLTLLSLFFKLATHRMDALCFRLFGHFGFHKESSRIRLDPKSFAGKKQSFRKGCLPERPRLCNGPLIRRRSPNTARNHQFPTLLPRNSLSSCRSGSAVAFKALSTKGKLLAVLWSTMAISERTGPGSEKACNNVAIALSKDHS